MAAKWFVMGFAFTVVLGLTPAFGQVTVSPGGGVEVGRPYGEGPYERRRYRDFDRERDRDRYDRRRERDRRHCVYTNGMRVCDY